MESASPAEAEIDAAAAPPPRRGRKPGSQNKVTGDLRDLIMSRGKPIELLCDVARGVKIRIGPQGGPEKPTYTYPSLADRLWAAGKLADKLIGDRKEQQLTGANDEPLFPAVEPDKADSRKTAMAILSLIRESSTGGTEPTDALAEVVAAAPAPIEPTAGPEVGESYLIDGANGAKAQLVFRDPAGNERWALITGAGECLERHHPTKESVAARAKLLAEARRI